jgi:hypothetical protein
MNKSKALLSNTYRPIDQEVAKQTLREMSAFLPMRKVEVEEEQLPNGEVVRIVDRIGEIEMDTRRGADGFARPIVTASRNCGTSIDFVSRHEGNAIMARINLFEHGPGRWTIDVTLPHEEKLKPGFTVNSWLAGKNILSSNLDTARMVSIHKDDCETEE